MMVTTTRSSMSVNALDRWNTACSLFGFDGSSIGGWAERPGQIAVTGAAAGVPRHTAQPVVVLVPYERGGVGDICNSLNGTIVGGEVHVDGTAEPVAGVD